MKNKLTLISAILLPALLIQTWNGSYKSIGIILPLTFFLILAYLVLSVYGIIKKKTVLALAFPLFVVSFYLFFQLINWQIRSNDKNAAKLIVALQSYKSKNGHFPKSLPELSSKYILKVPKEYYGISSKGFSYHTSENDSRFSLELKRNKTPYKIYESGISDWQFID